MSKLLTKFAFCLALGCSTALPQEPSVASVEKYLLTAVVAVAFQYPKAQIIAPANKSVLADVHSICVLPFDGFTAQSVTGALPDLSPISDQLSKSKLLRQQRYVVAQELGKRGFSVVDVVIGDTIPILLCFCIITSTCDRFPIADAVPERC